MIGWLKDSSGGYTAPMLVLTGVAALAVAYFAVLLRLLPVKRSSAFQTSGWSASDGYVITETECFVHFKALYGFLVGS